MNEAKSQLAKLLAQEGVEVVHDPKMDTAAFDPKKRILYLPVLKEMSGDVYDLFVCNSSSSACVCHVMSPVFTVSQIDSV